MIKKEYYINICPVEGFPIAVKISEKEFTRLITTFNAENTKKVIYTENTKSIRYKIEKDGEKLILEKIEY